MSDETEDQSTDTPDVGDEWGDALKEQSEGETHQQEETASGEEDPWADAMEEQAASEAPVAKVDDAAKPAEMAELQSVSPKAPEHDVNINAILDVPLTISLQVGKTEISIRNLLQLNQGSVVELDRMAGDPLDVTVNGTLIAHGEVVVVNDKFGIRLTDIISPAERIRNLS